METKKNKKNQNKAASKEEELDSEENQMMKDLEEFNSDKSWSELDELEQHLFNGSHEESSPDDQPIKIRRKDRRRLKEEEIADYEEALKAIEQENKIFVPHNKPAKLNINESEYIQMIRQAIDKDSNTVGVARMLGIKTESVLPKQVLNQQLQLVASYIMSKVVPKKFEDEHNELLSTQGNQFFTCSVKKAECME